MVRLPVSDLEGGLVAAHEGRVEGGVQVELHFVDTLAFSPLTFLLHEGGPLMHVLLLLSLLFIDACWGGAVPVAIHQGTALAQGQAR